MKRHIEFEVGDLVWLNIKNFKMLKTLANRFIPKYMGPYKIIRKPYPNVYTLQLLMMLVTHLIFHVSKLKPIHEDKKEKDRKHAHHPWFNLIEHKLVGEAKCIQTMERMSPKKIIAGETRSFKPFVKNGSKVWTGTWPQDGK